MEQVCAEAAAEKMKAQQDREKLQQLEHANGDHDPSLQIDDLEDDDPTEMIQDILMDLVNNVTNICSVSTKAKNLTREQYANILQKDCYMVFRCLCKLSMK